MCINCWIENGSLKIINDKTTKAAELIDGIYEQDDCGAGGYAHIVVDDWNLDDSSIDFCIEEAYKGKYAISEEGRLSCIACLLFLKTLTEEERYSAMAIQSGMGIKM